MPAAPITVTVKGLNEQIAKLAQSDKEVKKELKKGIGQGLKAVKSEVNPRIPSFSGRTLKGFRSSIRQAKGGMWWEGKYYNRHPFYLRMVQKGRGPGKAPYYFPERLVAWVAARTGATGSELRARVVGFLKSIEASGTQGYGEIMQDALDKTRGPIEMYFWQAVQRIVALLEVRK